MSLSLKPGPWKVEYTKRGKNHLYMEGQTYLQVTPLTCYYFE